MLTRPTGQILGRKVVPANLTELGFMRIAGFLDAAAADGVDAPDRIEATRPINQIASNPVGGSAKRTFDIIVAGAALLVLSPLLLAVAALIKLTMGGPAIFGHTRVGYAGQPFRCYKFRSMVQNADKALDLHLTNNRELAREWESNQKLRNDPRVTPLGKLLRKSSLDELPQLVNIIRGDMSLIGPRPVTQDELSRYGTRSRYYLSARPGVTGLWQVSGRNLVSYRRRIVLDTAYVRRWSFKLDLAIMLRTIPALLNPSQTS